MFFLSPIPTSTLSITSISFSTGTDSPVNDDSCIFRLFASNSLISAGIKSPVSNTTISPGTKSFVGTVSTFPFLTTFVTYPLIFFNASNEDSALLSCTTPITALTTTISNIIIESVTPSPSRYPTTPETNAAIINTIIIKSLN